MLVVTTDTLPGYEVVDVLGEVFGTVACTRNRFDAHMKDLQDGIDPEMAGRLVRVRAAAVTQMIGAARRRGATAIVGMRFDSREVTGAWMELCAYGTAVKAERPRSSGDRASVS